MTYFAETGSAKADCVADWIIDTYFYKEAQPVKILLFAHHTAVMDVFSMRFERAVCFYYLLVYIFLCLED